MLKRRPLSLGIYKNMQVNKFPGSIAGKLGCRVGSALIITLLLSCWQGSAYILVPQHWNDTEFLVEIRPGAPTRGMNEFVIVATDVKGVPGYEYVVSIRMNEEDKWQQMIQDGHSGVYRRAIAVDDPENGVLSVQLKHKRDADKQTGLNFPLAKHVQKP